MMKQLARLAAPLAALFTLSGCLQNEVTVNVKSDGTGTVVEETLLSAQMSAMLGGLGGLAPEGQAPQKDPLEEMFGEDAAKKKAAKMGEGVTFQKVEKLDQEGKKGARITYAFKDINKLQLRLDAGTDAMQGAGAGMPGADAAAAEVEAAKAKSEPIRFQKAGDKLTVMMPKPDVKPGEDKPAEIPDAAAEMAKDPQAEAMAKAMFADMKVAVRLVVEPGIAETDATHVDGNKVTLMEMNFGELMQNAEGMKVLEQMENKKPEELADMLKGIKGVKVETKEKVTIEIK